MSMPDVCCTETTSSEIGGDCVLEYVRERG